MSIWGSSPVNSRLLNQQLASPEFRTPEEVVSHMCAVQAQDYRMMRWAVAMRTLHPSLKAFTRAFDSGRIIRTHLMRGTWQLVCAEDFFLLSSLIAPRAEAVIRGWMHANHIDIPAEEYARISDILCRTASDKGSATKEDFVTALSHRGIEMDDHRLSYHIRRAETSALLCSGSLLSAKASYSLVSERIGVAPKVDRDEALCLIAGKYFGSRSPATMEDFVWWTGLSLGDCRRAVALLGDRIHSERLRDREFYFLDGCRCSGVRKGGVLLLPPYDEYLIGYKSRDLVLPESFRPRAHNNSGNFYPVVARDGIVCENWSPSAKEMDAPDMAKAWADYQAFLKR